MTDEDDSLNDSSERILSDVRNFIKQIYHEAVNRELSPVNRTYICGCLVKSLDEALRHGLKNRYLGYWKIVHKIIHPDLYKKVTALESFSTAESSYLANGRAWICLALLDEAFVSYMNCFVNEKRLGKYYDKHSIVIASDLVNRFVSLITGLENVAFAFEMSDIWSLPKNVHFYRRLVFDERTQSPVDSGVASSLDLINGNIADGDLVIRRREKKESGKRHVSFHEDSIERTSSGRGRKLVWDPENARYSWGGEDLEALKIQETDFFRLKFDVRERGTPEGQEAQKLVIRRRKPRIDHQLLKTFDERLRWEMDAFQKPKSQFEIELPEKLIAMLGVESFKAYKLWSRILILTADSALILDKLLSVTRLKYSRISQILIAPHYHAFDIQTKKSQLQLVTGCQGLTEEILGRLEWQMRRLRMELPQYCRLTADDIEEFKDILGMQERICYLGLIRLQCDYEFADEEAGGKRGFLMYRFEGESWSTGEFMLRGGILYLFGESRRPQMAINLKSHCIACNRISNVHRPHMFSISLKNSQDLSCQNAFYLDLALKSQNPIKGLFNRFSQLFKEQDTRQLFFAAADEYELSDWMQGFLQVFSQESNINLKVDEYLTVLTNQRVLLFFKNVLKYQLFSSASVQEIVKLIIGPEVNDSYCFMELECMEASNSSSDWILHFGSREELFTYFQVLKEQFDGQLPLEMLPNEKCCRFQSSLAKEWFA